MCYHKRSDSAIKRVACGLVAVTLCSPVYIIQPSIAVSGGGKDYGLKAQFISTFVYDVNFTVYSFTVATKDIRNEDFSGQNLAGKDFTQCG